MTQVLDLNDEREYSHEMTTAKRKELRNLLQRGTFKVVLKEDLPKDVNVVPERFVLEIMSKKMASQSVKLGTLPEVTEKN